MKLIGRNNLVGNEKRKLAGPLFFFLVLLFKNEFKIPYKIIVATKHNAYPIEDEERE